MLAVGIVELKMDRAKVRNDCEGRMEGMRKEVEKVRKELEVRNLEMEKMGTQIVNLRSELEKKKLMEVNEKRVRNKETCQQILGFVVDLALEEVRCKTVEK